MHLERLLHSQGFGTRRECRALIRHGAVCVSGEACSDPFADFTPAGLEFSVDGQTWPYHASAYLMLNKPAGFECSQQPSHHPSVYGLLPAPLRRRGVQAVGRLDEDTTGLLLFSDDGQFIHALSAPKREVPKVYEVVARHPLSEAQTAALLAGVILHDDPRPVAATACARLSANAIRLTITGGRYHQVKRMLAAVGNRVEGLHRVAVGDLALPPDLASGQWRWLSAAELATLGAA